MNNLFGIVVSIIYIGVVIASAKVFEKAGAQVVILDMPEISQAVPVYYVIACAEASSNLALSKYRLKTKEYKNATEKKALNKDVKDMQKLINQNSKDIAWIIKKIQKRK